MSLPRHSTFPLRTAAANRLGSRGGGGWAAKLLMLLGLLGPQLARAAAGGLAAPEGSFVEHWFVPTLIVGVLAVVGVSAAGAITRRTLLREIARLEQESRATRERAERLEGSEQRARSELAATTRARNAFLATLGQEVRTPMNSILGLNGLLLDTSLTSHQRQLADGVQTSAEALLSIVHDLLDLSRIEKGQSSVEETDLHFRQVLECAVDMYADRAHRKGLELVSHVLREVPTHLRGDPARIRQVLLSMIGNAVRMASGGEVLVEAACGAPSPDAVEVTVAVTHQGQGLSASALESLARDAGQPHAVPVEVSEGPGLGISVSARLLHLMGGRLAPAPAAHDRAGLVARFRLKRPAVQESLAATTESRTTPFRGHALAVASAHPKLRAVLRHHLESWGASPCVECGTGTELLNALRRARQEGNQIRVAIIDHALPDVNGTELARAIRADTLISGTRLVALKPLAESFDSQQLRNDGFDSWVTKPVRQSHLIHALLHATSTIEGNPNTLDPAPPIQVRPVGDELSGLRVLVAEDNLPNQVFARLLMLRLGFEASVAENGVRSLELLGQEPFDLVLMDCHMPQLDGFEATRMIRACGAPWSSVPIIAVTADTVPGVREACLTAGMDDYVSKPLKTEELLRAIRKVIALRQNLALGAGSTASTRS